MVLSIVFDIEKSVVNWDFNIYQMTNLRHCSIAVVIGFAANKTA